jgi:hypothetical protein
VDAVSSPVVASIDAACPQVYDHDATVPILVWAERRTWTGTFEGNLEAGLLLPSALLLLSFSPPDLLDDERRQHGMGTFLDRGTAGRTRPRSAPTCALYFAK